MEEMISFLGPKGTFSHEAASLLGDNLVPYCTIPAVMESIDSNQCDMGIVPIENSIEGPVGITLDSLAHDFDLNIVGEVIISINQNLIVNPGTKLEDIKDVYSHQQAISQCHNFIEKNSIQPHYAVSTASAAKSIIGDKSKAAIGHTKSAELYDLDILLKDIQDVDNNETRFVVLSKDETDPSGNDKTSIIFSIYEDHPGSLYKILGIFNEYEINLTKIESRPSKQGLGKYLFFVDFYGHYKDNIIKKIIMEIEDKTYFFKVLGSYPEFK
ncbi:prephenate dehydratase [Methanobrevibacter sp.]|uniref:prephenate dehydratase n=1 Tax=Methanobrevibacter sp. TaxID=66852 RepID=UPI0038908052